MKIKTKTSELLSAVKLAAQAAGKKTTYPLLNHLLLKAEGTQLVIIGSNIQSFIQASCPCEVEQAGALGLPAEKLLSFLTGASAEETSFELTGKKVRGITGRTVVDFAFIESEQFPTMPKIPQGWAFSLTEKEAHRCFSTVKAAQCDNVGRATLCGVNVRLGGGRAEFTATAGNFLMNTHTPHTGEGEAIIPSDLVDFIIRSLNDDSDSSVDFHFSENAVMVVGVNFDIFGALVEGKFPDWRGYMPKDGKRTYTLPRQSVKAGIQKVRPFTDERFHPIWMKFKDSVMELKNSGGEHSVSHTIELDCLVSEFECQLNPDYLEKVLDAMQGEKVDMRVIDNLNPLMFEEQDFLGIIQVCRLQ